MSLLTKKPDLIATEHIQQYLRHKYRRNCRANTLCNDYTAITLFKSFLKKCGKTALEHISRDDLKAFVEHEQDRGLKISSVRNRVAALQPFLRFLIKAQLVNPQVLSQPIRLRVPKSLPRTMVPHDLNCLLAVLDDVRNRAMILMLLRTGMRIGELLNTNGKKSLQTLKLKMSLNALTSPPDYRCDPPTGAVSKNCHQRGLNWPIRIFNNAFLANSSTSGLPGPIKIRF